MKKTEIKIKKSFKNGWIVYETTVNSKTIFKLVDLIKKYGNE